MCSRSDRKTEREGCVKEKSERETERETYGSRKRRRVSE